MDPRICPQLLALFLPLAPDTTGVALLDGSSVSEAAWALHQECKYDLIATLPRSGGHLPAETIRAWITTHPIFPADPPVESLRPTGWRTTRGTRWMMRTTAVSMGD